VTRLDEYREVAPRGVVEVIQRLAERVRGRRFLHVTAGRLGGGPTEVLAAGVPILNDLEIDTRWEVSGGDSASYVTGRALRAALEGVERVVSDEALAHWAEVNRRGATKIDLDADLVIVHDAQPASLVAARPGGRWVWRCHVDASHATRAGWAALKPYVEAYDAMIVSLPGFGPRAPVTQYVIPPSIDPLSEKNREMREDEVAAVLAPLGVATDKPLLLQVGPFSRDYDPLGVVNAYRLVKRHHDVRLVLAGTAEEERESREVLADLGDAAAHDADIRVLELPAEAHRQINALQRAATIVFLKSHRGGFGLSAAEAMWKGKPVIGGAAGGLRQQVIAGVTGFVIHSVEGAAFRVRQLLNNPEQVPRMGAAGREHVRRAFLLTRHLTDYLALMSHLTR
jgi:trehalose synthase